MNDQEKLPEWTGQARQLLDDSAAGIDAATLSKLNRARQAALQGRGARASRPWFLPAGLAGACAVLLAVAVVWMHHSPASNVLFGDAQGNGSMSDNDLEMVASDDGIEFYQDLDFYAWLDSQTPDNNG